MTRHPLAREGAKSGAYGMKSGDRIQHHLYPQLVGTADEFLQDGTVLVSWDNGTHSELKWGEVKKLEAIT